MAIALTTATSLVRQDYATVGAPCPAVTLTSVVLPANSIVVHVGVAYSYYNGPSYTAPTNTGTALTWNFVDYSDVNSTGDPNFQFVGAIFWAYNATAQTISISSSQNPDYISYQLGHAASAYVFTGANTTNPIPVVSSSGYSSLLKYAGFQYIPTPNSVGIQVGSLSSVSPTSPVYGFNVNYSYDPSQYQQPYTAYRTGITDSFIYGNTLFANPNATLSFSVQPAAVTPPSSLTAYGPSIRR